MTESAYSSIRGAEISERSTELVLPSSAAAAALDDSPIVEDASSRANFSGAANANASFNPPSNAASNTASNTASNAAPSSATTGGWRTAGLAGGTGASTEPGSDDDARHLREPRAGMHGYDSPIAASPSEGTASLERGRTEATFDAKPQSASIDATESEQRPIEADRGQALPGDRGPREGAVGHPQRPSFWRRIALGRRSQALRAAQQEGETTMTASAATVPGSEGRSSELRTTPVVQRLVANRDAGRDDNALAARANEAVERRIVEPLLQALVSVEAKLERSHVDLVGRSDQVEQRLTQLWDIEEQLGGLGELQESVLHVTEQQRRLEAALVAQTRILRWLVGGIILSLAVAAFSVAFFLRVAR